MKREPQGEIRSSQVITTYGPGALIDLPRHSAIVSGLDSWPKPEDLTEISEPRLTEKLTALTGIRSPELFAPPAASSDPRVRSRGIRAEIFPDWFVVQEDRKTAQRPGSRRLAHRKALDERGRLDGRKVVATRFVRACPRGHVDDLDWRGFAHGGKTSCRRQLWLDEQGVTGDLGNLSVRCECGASQRLYRALEVGLGPCRGTRPWLNKDAREDCDQQSKLLIRTASNAYFPQVVSVLSLPDRGSELDAVISKHWSFLEIVESPDDLRFVRKKRQVDQDLPSADNETILQAIRRRRTGSTSSQTVKEAELDALLSAPEGFGDDVPVDPNFHARRLPETSWRQSSQSDGIEAVVQLHRLREVLALVGFTRLEAELPDIHGEYDSDVERANLALEPEWFPAVENRGEGIFIQLSADATRAWSNRESVQKRCDELIRGHDAWTRHRKKKRTFPGGPYILLHTLSHLLIQGLAMHCGYPASSIRERIYAESKGCGILLYTGSPDAEGTLGGLVQQATHLEDRLREAIQRGSLCSNDPICAQHVPGKTLDARLDPQALQGAACQGCSLISETSCEMQNDYLDRALVVPVLDREDVAFFRPGS